MLSLATTRSLLKQLRVGSGEGLDLVALKDCFSSARYRRLGTHLPEYVARNHGCPDYSVSYPLLVPRYLMIPGLDVETRHKRLDKASAYLLFTGGSAPICLKKSPETMAVQITLSPTPSWCPAT